MLPFTVLRKQLLKRSALFFRECGIHKEKGEWVMVVVGL